MDIAVSISIIIMELVVNFLRLCGLCTRRKAQQHWRRSNMLRQMELLRRK